MATPIKPRPGVAPPRPALPAPRGPVAAPPQAIVRPSVAPLAAPGQWDDQLAVYADEQAAIQPIPGGQFISLRSGIISVDGNDYDSLSLYIIDFAFERTYYSQGFDENNPTNPDCFAISRTDAECETPHGNVKAPYSPTCSSCPLNKWGTDVKDGEKRKGKGCKERRRIAVVAYSEEMTAADLENPDIRYIRTPVTSNKALDTYVHFVRATYKRPPFAMVTHFSLEKDRKTQFKCKFVPVAPAPDHLMQALIDLHDRFKAQDTILFPYGSVESNAVQS